MVEIRFEVDTALSPPASAGRGHRFLRTAAPDLVGSTPSTSRSTPSATPPPRSPRAAASSGIWARERYDWSDPDRVVARVLDSNIFGSGSRWELRVRPAPAGGGRVEWTSLRQPGSLKGRLVVLVLRVAGRQHLRGYLQQTLAKLENQTA